MIPLSSTKTTPNINSLKLKQIRHAIGSNICTNALDPSSADSMARGTGDMPITPLLEMTGQGCIVSVEQHTIVTKSATLITKALSKTTSCTCIAKKVEEHDKNVFRRFSPYMSPSGYFERERLGKVFKNALQTALRTIFLRCRILHYSLKHFRGVDTPGPRRSVPGI